MKLPNPYESGEQKVIPSVLLYAFHQDRVLMIHRNSNQTDFHLNKWNGLGGKQERGESPEACAVREFFEESGCTTQIEHWRWMGHLQFPDFKPHKKEDWFVTVLTIELDDASASSIQSKTPEGTLHWIPSSQVLDLNLWEGDRVFLPFVLRKKRFTGTFYYHEGKLSHSLFNPIID